MLYVLINSVEKIVTFGTCVQQISEVTKGKNVQKNQYIIQIRYTKIAWCDHTLYSLSDSQYGHIF